MTFCFDIDGTICTNTHGKYAAAEPYPEVVARINSLFSAGHRILLNTARGTTTKIDWRELTAQQLAAWGVRYHELRLGKPEADLYIDDKGVNVSEWMLNTASPQSDGASAGGPAAVIAQSRYLEVTYSEQRCPFGGYPYELTNWLAGNVYGKPGRLLDLGCGRGEHLAGFAKLGFDVVGADISPRAPALAPEFHVLTADLESNTLPGNVGQFDYVFSKSVLEHIHCPDRFLENAIRVLRPGGIAAVMTPSWAHTYWGPFYIDHTHVSPFTRPSLANALELAGFEDIRVYDFYQLPFLWRYPLLKPLVLLLQTLPLPYRPYQASPWSEKVNKLIRFSKEVMLLAVARKPASLERPGAHGEKRRT